MNTFRPFVRALLLGFIMASALGSAQTGNAAPATVGDSAPNFSLNTLSDQKVELKNLLTNKPVVLVVLRGWPGYQCPICSKQVEDFVSHAPDFDAKGLQVVMVYPGPSENLKAHAQEFTANKQWPKNIIFLTDPDYHFTNSYGLRWKEEGETAYPSTFIIGRRGKIRFAKVSQEHGGRATAQEVLEAWDKVKQ